MNKYERILRSLSGVFLRRIEAAIADGSVFSLLANDYKILEAVCWMKHYRPATELTKVKMTGIAAINLLKQESNRDLEIWANWITKFPKTEYGYVDKVRMELLCLKT